eukprot:jgi/Psemu1/24384/gm1.24384_g
MDVKDNTREKANEENRDKTVRDETGDENNLLSNANGNESDNGKKDKDKDKDKDNNDKGIRGDTTKPKDNINEVVGDKTGDEIDPLFNANRNDSHIDDNDKDKDKEDMGMGGEKMKSPKKKKGSKEEETSKEDPKSGTQQNGKKEDARLYSNNKQALMILMEKKGKEELIRKGIGFDDQTLEQTLREIANVEDMTKKLQRPGRKKPDYKEGGSDDDSNSKKELDNENESKDKVDEEAVAMVPVLQYIVTDKNEDGPAKNKAIEPKDMAEKRQHGKIIFQVCHHGGQNEW